MGFLAAFPALAQTLYTPTSAWLVGPVTQAVPGHEKVPCVAVNQFNNGFVFRLSGGGGQLMAMAIDFRQKAFDFDKKYEVEFSVPGAYFQTVTATPYDHGTLLFNLYKFPDFYKALKNAETLTIKTGNQTLSFSMMGLKDGFERMESCYAPVKQQGEEAVVPGMQEMQAAPAAASNIVQRPSSDPVPQGEVTPANPLIAQDQQNALTPMPGEEIKTLSAAAPVVPDMVPEPPQEQSPAEPTHAEQMAAAASLAEKANIAQRVADQLVQRNPVKKDYSGYQMAQAWTQTDVVRKSRDIISSAASPGRQVPQAPAAPQTMRWRVLEGSSLHDVLELWAKSTNSTLVWQGDDFPVTRSMVMEGTFESAVQKLLEQYNDSPARPVGRMYRDSKTAQSVLVIETLKTPQ